MTNDSESKIEEDEMMASDSQTNSFGFDSEEYQLTKNIKTEPKVRIISIFQRVIYVTLQILFS